MEDGQKIEEHQVEDEAAYATEATVKCPLCTDTLATVHVVRLLRTKVNFTSTLPRRGYVVICPSCRGIIPAAVVSWLT
jgi:adenine-specific DNA methylase